MDHEKSENILSHAELLKNFGVTEALADDMLNDQGLFILFRGFVLLKFRLQFFFSFCFFNFTLFVFEKKKQIKKIQF